MSDYSAVFLDHYRRPRNLGDLEAPDGTALLREDACGDLLRLVLSVERSADGGDDGARITIRAARFKAFGCAATIAVGSILTEMVTGKSLQAAAAIGVADLTRALGGLPPGRVHAAVLGHAALCAAIEQASEKQETGATGG